MTRLTLAARNKIVQIPAVQDLVSAGKIGKSATWTSGWIFDSRPQVEIETSSAKCMVVVADDGTWLPPNAHNTEKFLAMFVDVWASPTRNTDGSQRTPDAEFLIETVFEALLPELHTVHPAGPDGEIRWWGTASQIENRTGLPVFYSQKLTEIEFSPVEDGNGAVMGRVRFGVATA